MTKAQESPHPARSQPKVVLIEDETMIRQMMQIMLLKERGWKDVVGFGNGAEGLAYCLKDAPTLLIVDLDLPGKNGWDIAIEMKSKAPKTLILILTSNDMKRKPSEFMKLGVNGYVDKTAPYTQLLQAIDVVMSGALFFSADPVEDEAAAGVKPAKSTDPRLVLSPDELAIARLVVAGLSSKEIAVKRDLTARSIDKHRANIMAKLGVNQAAGLVRLCVQHGIS
ncbi:MAG TPA: response regulator transcription factor [Opitutaceae bacterium]|jgi:DNA-binding NarL/FixJ family response regulator|nr:response regulator transcription factor [Opitutaceae bacterium]